MSNALILELLARGIAVGALLGMAILALRGGFSPARVTGALFAFAAAAHTLTQWPGGEIAAALGGLMAPVQAVSAAGAGLLWAFVSELFADRARLEWQRFAPAALLLVIGMVLLSTPQPLPQALVLAHKLGGGVLIIHAAFLVASGWRNDLVDRRRRLRGPVLALALVYALGVISVEASELVVGSARALSPLGAAGLVALGLVSLAAFGQADADLFGPAKGAPSDPVAAAEAPVESPQVAQEAGASLSKADRDAVGTLEHYMSSDRPYREEGLTIAVLALRLKLPEHRLRRLINQGMGYRNFNDYLNNWRLAEARAALADPEQAPVPVATIALDAGFGSLGPFNRAFKAHTGLTPSAYRARALGQHGAANS